MERPSYKLDIRWRDYIGSLKKIGNLYKVNSQIRLGYPIFSAR